MKAVVHFGDFELLDSGWFQTSGEENIDIKVADITARITCEECAEKGKETNTETILNHEKLIMIFRVTGPIPASPFTYGTTIPIPLGTSEDKTLWISWKLSKPKKDCSNYDVAYAIYQKARNEHPAAAESVKKA
jgi:hypothetical protein